MCEVKIDGFMSIFVLLSCRTQKYGENPQFWEKCQNGAEMIFLKIFKNTPKKSNIRPTQNVYKTFDFPFQCIIYLLLCDACLLCENSKCHKNKAVSKNQTSSTFLMLGRNPRMTSGKITFLRDSCGDFFLASKM